MFETILDNTLNEAYFYRDKKYANLEGVLDQIFEDYGENSYVSYTHIDKLGINPRSQYDTPLGIYMYPLNYIIDNNYKVPFAGDRPFLNVVRFKNVDNIIKLANKAPTQDEKNSINRLISKVKPEGDDWPSSYDQWAQFLLVSKNYEMRSNYSILWLALRELSHNNPIKWRKLFIRTGIEGIVDNNTGTIHQAEPTQAVAFAQSSLRIIERLANTDSKMVRQSSDGNYEVVDAYGRRYGKYDDIYRAREVASKKSVSKSNMDSVLEKYIAKDNFKAIETIITKFSDKYKLSDSAYYLSFCRAAKDRAFNSFYVLLKHISNDKFNRVLKEGSDILKVLGGWQSKFGFAALEYLIGSDSYRKINAKELKYSPEIIDFIEDDDNDEFDLDDIISKNYTFYSSEELTQHKDDIKKLSEIMELVKPRDITVENLENLRKEYIVNASYGIESWVPF